MAAPQAARHAPRTGTAGRGAARLDSLTGLRWWAAFAIFLSHVNVLLPVPGTRGLFGLGVAGVTFFFILSGFVLAWTALDSDTPGWFYARRFARIWPLLLLSVALPLLFALTKKPEGDDPSHAHLALVGLASVLLVQAWVPGWILTGPSPVTWSLSCEAFFYALFPLLHKTIVRRTLRQLLWIAVAAVAVGWAIRAGTWLGYTPKRHFTTDDLNGSGWLLLGTYSPVARVNEFVLGVVCAVAVKRGVRLVAVRTAVAGLAVALGVLWLLRNQVWRAQVPYDAVDQVCAPFFALLITAVAVRDLDGRPSLLRSAPLVRLGQYSYAFYLFHFTIVLSVAMQVFPDKSVVSFFTDPVAASAGHIGWAVLALLVATALSVALYRWYEHPSEQRLRARLRRRLGPVPAPAR
jgi:peptidoglycan/LPS O-acetylase OafA/YrhL